jgi:hypothetical protein
MFVRTLSLERPGDGRACRTGRQRRRRIRDDERSTRRPADGGLRSCQRFITQEKTRAPRRRLVPITSGNAERRK